MKTILSVLLLCVSSLAQLNPGPNYIGNQSQFVSPPFPTWIMSQAPANAVSFPTMERPPVSIFTFPVMSWTGTTNVLGETLQFNFHWDPAAVAAVGLPTSDPASSLTDAHPNKGTTFIFIFFDVTGQPPADLQVFVPGAVFNLGPAFPGQPPMIEYVIPPVTPNGSPSWVSLAWPPTLATSFGEVAHNELIQGFPVGSAASTSGLQVHLNLFVLVPDDLGNYVAFFTQPVTDTL